MNIRCEFMRTDLVLPYLWEVLFGVFAREFCLKLRWIVSFFCGSPISSSNRDYLIMKMDN